MNTDIDLYKELLEQHLLDSFDESFDDYEDDLLSSVVYVGILDFLSQKGVNTQTVQRYQIIVQQYNTITAENHSLGYQNEIDFCEHIYYFMNLSMNKTQAQVQANQVQTLQARAQVQAQALQEAHAQAQAQALQEAQARAQARALQEAHAQAQARALQEAQARALQEAHAQAQARALQEAHAQAQARALQEAQNAQTLQEAQNAQARSRARARKLQAQPANSSTPTEPVEPAITEPSNKGKGKRLRGNLANTASSYKPTTMSVIDNGLPAWGQPKTI